MKDRWNFKTCYLIYPGDFNIKRLERILEELNLRVLNYNEIGEESLNFLKKIEQNIRRADFIISIFNGSESPNYFFEMGLAYGLKKTFFSVVDENVLNVPSYISNQMYLKIDIKDIEKIQFSLIQFLSNYKKTYYPYHKKYFDKIEDVKKIDINLNSLLKKLESLKKEGSGFEFENFIGEVLKNFNDIKYVKKQNISEKYFIDFSIWINGLDIISANPVLIETKIGNLTKNKLLMAKDQLERGLINLKTSIGIIVYLDLEEKDFSTINRDENIAKSLKYDYPLVMFLEVSDLFEMLKNQSLSKEIIKIRNKKLHMHPGDLRFG